MTNSMPHPIRRTINLVSFVLLSCFIIFFPVLAKEKQDKPEVKAAYTSSPSIPVSQDLTPPELTATGIFVFDPESGIILLEKNSHQRLKPASLTKIVTAMIAMEHYNDDSILQVKNGQNANGNTVKLKRGDSLIASDLLYALLVPSGNDAAVTLAENYPGGYQNFIAKMNDKVVELGLKDTHFSNVSGVEGGNHYTSAYDIAMLARQALRKPQFASIVSTQKITLQSLKGNYYPLETTNILLGKPGIYGVKTGWTPEAGECLVILAEKDNHPVIISLLNSKDRFGEAEQLVNWTFSNYHWQ